MVMLLMKLNEFPVRVVLSASVARLCRKVLHLVNVCGANLDRTS